MRKGNSNQKCCSATFIQPESNSDDTNRLTFRLTRANDFLYSVKKLGLTTKQYASLKPFPNGMFTTGMANTTGLSGIFLLFSANK